MDDEKVWIPEKQYRDKRFKWDEDILACKLEEYIDSTEYPILTQFCINNKISQQALRKIALRCKDIEELMELLQNKACAYIEYKALHDELNATFSIFRLKQSGWTDKQVVEQTVTHREDLSKLSTEELKQLAKEKLKELGD